MSLEGTLVALMMAGSSLAKSDEERSRFEVTPEGFADLGMAPDVVDNKTVLDAVFAPGATKLEIICDVLNRVVSTHPFEVIVAGGLGGNDRFVFPSRKMSQIRHVVDFGDFPLMAVRGTAPRAVCMARRLLPRVPLSTTVYGKMYPQALVDAARKNSSMPVALPPSRGYPYPRVAHIDADGRLVE